MKGKHYFRRKKRRNKKCKIVMIYYDIRRENVEKELRGNYFDVTTILYG